jgi:hypothetical protein
VQPAYLDTRPPKESSAQWWCLSGTNETEVLFKLTGPVGTVVDVHCDVRYIDSQNATAAENGTGAASSVGKVYWNYLDGFAGTKGYTPTGGVAVLP